MYYSMTFTDPNYETKHNTAPEDGRIKKSRNTWDDWHLIPTSRPSFVFPEAKTNYVDVPGSNNSIDLSESLTNYPSYKDRSGSFEFLVMNDQLDTNAGERIGYDGESSTQWSGVASLIANYIHGQKMYLEFESEPGWYYIGRFQVDSWSTGENYSTITIKYVVDPFKYSITSSADLWKWDPFNFETGVIRTYDGISYSGDDYTEFKIIGTMVPVVPTLYANTDSTLVLQNGASYTLASGENKNPMIVVYPYQQTWKIKANTSGTTGSLSVYFRERSF